MSLNKMLVVTCNKCLAWYNMDMMPGLEDDHFDMYTGKPCHNEDSWAIHEVPYRNDWQEVR